MNLVELPVVDGGVQFGTATVPVSRTELQSTASRTVIVDVRPEDLAIADDGLEFHVSVVEELGSDAYAYGHADLTGSGIDQQQTVVARVDWRQPPRNGGSSQTIAGRATHAARVRPGQRRRLAST
jgi:multiple sugar transport system ATP-binding protein